MESTFLSGLILIAAIALLGAMSPGPDFAIVTKNSLMYSRRSGMYTAFGVSLGICVHLAYCLISIAFSLTEASPLFLMIKYSGALYLIYLGIQLLQAKPVAAAVGLEMPRVRQDLPPLEALRSGFLTNALNPKATMFFLSVFSQVIDVKATWEVQLIYALEIVCIALAWFLLLAFLLSHPNIKHRLIGVQHYVERGMGVILFAFGLHVLFTA